MDNCVQMYHTVSDFAGSFKFTNDVKNMKRTFELLIVSRQQHIFFTDKWVSLRNRSLFVTQNVSIEGHFPSQMFYRLNCQDQTLSTSCIWILIVVISWNTTTWRYLFVKVACEMLPVHRQMDSPEKQSFLAENVSFHGTYTPIHS